MKRCLLLYLFFLVQIAHGQDISEIDVSFQYQPPSNDDLTLNDLHLQTIESKVQQLLTRNGLGSNNSTPFVIKPAVDIYETTIVEGMQNIYVTDGEFSLFISQVNGPVFSSYTQRIRGSGRNEKQSILGLVRKIPTSGSALKEFFDDARKKIADYYDENCDRIIAEIDALKIVEDYDGAMYKLGSIPVIAEGCYPKAVQQMEEVYVASLNRDCEKFLNVAESAMALRRFEAAAHALVQIHPKANCYASAAKIKTEIIKETGDEYERIWAYENKSLELAGNAIDSKYKAVAEVYKASNTNSRPLFDNTTSPANSNSGISINNLAIGNQQGGAIPPMTPPVIEKSESVEFKVVSPSVRAATGDVVVYEESITVYGLIDDPKSAKTLLVDGLETSWDKEGIFSRAISVKDSEKDIQIKLFDKKGEYATQSLKIKRLKKNDQTPKVIDPQELKKNALVIGISDYQHISKLKNPKNDAEDMSILLKNIGFEVTTVLDADFETIRKQVGKFAGNKESYDVSLFFFAGHGLELDGENFLLPVDVKGETREEIKLNTLSVSQLTKYLEMTNDDKLNIIILDACRNNPFPNGDRSVGGGTGLARVTPATGMLIAYATSPGSTASDGTGENGLYTGELIKQMSIPQRIEDVFMNTRNEVEDKSNGRQKPWEEARLRGVFYLKTE
ncbi:MAG: caspase family protein [Cytophagales bacterium]|nr:caspase family protein [Cytophagales bacterium]